MASAPPNNLRTRITTSGPPASFVTCGAPQRDSHSENFPVGSRLLPARTRRHVLAFYRFARATDDIADSPNLGVAEKVAALDAVLAVFDGAPPEGPAGEAAELHAASLRETGIDDLHARALLAAFRRDALNPRCADWADLMDYCRLSAASVGRFLVDLHGENRDSWPASDALCSALQVLNHLQDCGDDLIRLDRVYLPLDWMAEEGAGIDDLRQPNASPALRRVIDRCLDETDRLIATARGLPRALGRSRLRYEAAVIVVIAERLSRRLRKGDPLAERIELGRLERLACLATGLFRAWRLP